jgi:putative ABC transport system substrate-binding protein
MLATLLLAASLLSPVAQARDRVAVVVSDDLDAYTAPVGPFVDELGSTAEIINIHGREAEAKQMVGRLKSDLPDVVYCVGAKACYAVHQAMPKVPLVYSTVYEPERYGITGARVSGVTMTVEPVTFLSQFVGFFPSVQRIGVVRGPGMTDKRWLTMAAAAVELGMELVEYRVRSPREVRNGMVELARQGVDALWVPPDRQVLTSDNFRTVAEESRRRRLPLLVDTQNMVEAGGLYTLTPDHEAVGRQAARIAQQLLSGAAPSEVGTEDPEALLVVLNVRTIDRAALDFDRLLLDFVDVVVD